MGSLDPHNINLHCTFGGGNLACERHAHPSDRVAADKTLGPPLVTGKGVHMLAQGEGPTPRGSVPPSPKKLGSL